MSDTKLTNQELADKLEQWAHSLAESRGSSWVLQIPANHKKDPDLLICEAAERLRGIPDISVNVEQAAQEWILSNYCTNREILSPP